MQVGLLTESQKNELVGQLYAKDSHFNPILDNSENWIISLEEINQCVTTDFLWVKDLPLIDYVAKPSPLLPGME